MTALGKTSVSICTTDVFPEQVQPLIPKTGTFILRVLRILTKSLKRVKVGIRKTPYK